MGREEYMSHRSGKSNNFGGLFDEAILLYQSLNEEETRLKVNKAWPDAFGYRREEVTGKLFGDFPAMGFSDNFKEKYPIFKAADKIDNIEFKRVTI